ncbi:AMP-binding protein [Rhizobium helianthi]|uniref:AMP-binding protein n=1 Tax=Rhizobium helianthi TaxID=1132695 RepID=A0ABW4M1N3_9HYPH
MLGNVSGDHFSETLIARDPVSYRARISPDRIAARSLADGITVTYREMDERIARCASVLNELLGSSVPGATVAALGRNSIDHLVLAFACQRVNCIFVPLNWRLGAVELTDIVADCDARLLVFEDDFGPVARELGAKSGVKLLGYQGDESSLDGLIRKADPLKPLPATGNEPAILLYTSGTTGTPKGVILTRSNLFYAAYNFSVVGEVAPGAVTFCDLPFFHTIGLVAIARTTLMMGGTLIVSDRFLPERTIDCLNDEDLAVTHYFAVPQMATILRDQPGYSGERMKRLKAIFIGGAPLPPPLVEAYLADGVALVNGYGMSEAGTVLHMPIDHQAISTRHGSVGFPAPLIDVKIMDAQGQACEAGQVGELWIRGPSISSGYWKKPEQTAASFVNGWFRTGDLVRCDEDGFHIIADRLKDMYISGGENVYPAEVEAVLLSHDAVAEVAVIGVPDEKWGEVGVAFVVARNSAKVGADELINHCKSRLATYKRPARIEFLEAIPRNAAGKPLKHVLRDRATG